MKNLYLITYETKILSKYFLPFSRSLLTYSLYPEYPNPPSRQVIRKFVQMAEGRAEEASREAKSSSTSIAEVEDLDMVYTPEK